MCGRAPGHGFIQVLRSQLFNTLPKMAGVGQHSLPWSPVNPVNSSPKFIKAFLLPDTMFVPADKTTDKNRWCPSLEGGPLFSIEIGLSPETSVWWRHPGL